MPTDRYRRCPRRAPERLLRDSRCPALVREALATRVVELPADLLFDVLADRAVGALRFLALGAHLAALNILLMTESETGSGLKSRTVRRDRMQ